MQLSHYAAPRKGGLIHSLLEEEKEEQEVEKEERGVRSVEELMIISGREELRKILILSTLLS